MPQPAAHPPSPRQQRADAARAAVRVAPENHAATTRKPNSNYLRLHWLGELPLAVAVIVNAAIVWALVQMVAFVSRRFPITEFPRVSASLWIAEALFLMLGVVWWGGGVVRSAGGHVRAGGSILVAALTGAAGIGAFFFAGAFWWQSARYVMPDVWATLAGTAPPAAVEIERAVDGTPRLRVSGDLEFGTTLAVRAALDANRAIDTVHFESRGGRAAEGLALGRLLLDRNKNTLVLDECSSACVTAFAGGARRSITSATKLGLHSAGGQGVSAADLAAANRKSDTFIANRGVDARVLEEGASVANADIWFPPTSVLTGSGLATDVVDGRR